MRLLSQPYGICILAAIAAGACAGNFDTTREQRAYQHEATLGQEVYGVLCDRVGASALAEDLSGQSYRAVCHPDQGGRYADAVDASLLAPVGGTAAGFRNLGIAKVEALARRRDEVVRAIDTILPDIEIADPFPTNSTPTGAKVRLHDAVAELLQRLNPLYDSNPLADQGGTPDPLLPASTQALGRLLQTLIDSREAREQLAHIGGRKGYRPLSSALGAIAPVLAYPDLRTFAQQTVRVLSPGGPAREQFVHLLNVVHEELRTSATSMPVGPFAFTGPEDRAQPTRGRETLELLQNVLFTTDPGFALSSVKPGLIVLRDHRGFVTVAGSKFGVPGSVRPPFADINSDGLADVDTFGRFVDGAGGLVEVDWPFPVPEEPRVRPADTLGRALLDDGRPAYEYIDTTQTLVASLLLRDLPGLLDPEPTHEHETLMDAFAGAIPLLGDRVSAEWTYEKKGESGPEKATVRYRAFAPETSPLVDLAYAAGQVLAHPQSDDLLQQWIDLFENHEQQIARFVGVALEIDALADKHNPPDLPEGAFFWDHLAQVVSEMSDVYAPNPTDPNDQHDRTSLLEDMLLALANERSLGLADVYSKFFLYRDVMNYDPENLNGPAVHRSQPPFDEVERSEPIREGNKSMFMRSMDMVFDSTRTVACNRGDAKVHMKAKLPKGAFASGVLEKLVEGATYPDTTLVFGLCGDKRPRALKACGVFRIEDLTKFYLQSLIESDENPPGPLRQPRKAQLEILDPCLNWIADGGLMGVKVDMDATLVASSGIEGLDTTPSYQALNRLVFFGAGTSDPSIQMPDIDPYWNGINKTTYDFITDLQDPMGTPLCKKSDDNGVNECKSPNDTLRVRNPGTLMLWELFGFADANRPLLYSFYKYDREDLFADMVDVLHYHWRDETHGDECEASGGYDRDVPEFFNARYCSEAGLVRYEPLMSDALKTDLIPAVHELVKVLRDQRIRSTRYRKDQGHTNIERRGTELAAFMTQLVFSEKTSLAMGLRTQNGKQTTLWNDGKTPKDQITLFDLLADALRRVDERFDSAQGHTPEELKERHAQWKRARSQLVDQFLAVEGSGADARFKNPAVPKAIVSLLKMLREQLNYHCPDRETGGDCTWAKEVLANKVGDILRDPLFSAVVDLMDELRKGAGRVELERLAQYLLRAIDNDQALRSVLASSVDIVQVLRDGQTIPPLLNVLSSLSAPDTPTAPGAAPPAPGAADITLQLLNVLSRDPEGSISVDDPLVFDRYHVLEHILPNLVKPIDASRPSRTALEVLIDVAIDVHRENSASTEPLTAYDHCVMAASVKQFLTNKQRGMEQLYTVVRGANGAPSEPLGPSDSEPSGPSECARLKELP